MPARLRPTAPIAPDAVLVGDPGRALLLAQELLQEPKMSNHARGLWGYSGQTAAGDRLTIQSTGMGGPSAAIVLSDLAELGVRRAIRIGTCVAADPACDLGELLLVAEARGEGTAVAPDHSLTAGLGRELEGEARAVAIASFDDAEEEREPVPGIAASDLQTATVLGRGRALGIAPAAVLIVERTASGARISDESLEMAAKLAGRAAAAILST